MKKIHHSVLILFVISLFSSCTIEERLERKEDRLMGAWVFEKAFYNDDNDLFRDNLTRDYEGDILEFFEDRFVLYEDVGTNEVFYGDWGLNATRRQFDDEQDVEFFLDMEFYDDRDRFAFSYFSTVTRLTWNKLHFKVHDRAGVYTFRLRKL